MKLNTFQYLNHANIWPNFELSGLEIDPGGGLQLMSVPGPGQMLSALPWLSAAHMPPLGMAYSSHPGGRLFISDPREHTLWVWEVCDGTLRRLEHLDGPGGGVGELKRPLGLLSGPRRALYVADSGNDRIQVIDLHTLTVREVWAGLAEPVMLVADTQEDIYVLERGVKQIQKRNVNGVLDPAFWNTLLTQSLTPSDPLALCLIHHPQDGREQLAVLDGDRSLLVYELDGQLDGAASAAWSGFKQQVPQAIQLASVGGRMFVMSAGSGRITAFDLNGQWRGLSVAAGDVQLFGLLARSAVELLTISERGLLQVAPAAGYVENGRFLAGPFTSQISATEWKRLQITQAEQPLDTHWQLYALSDDVHDGSPGNIPTAPQVDPTGWLTLVKDSLDGALDLPVAHYLWLAGSLRGEGTDSPRFFQARLDYNRPGWERHLPQIYRKDAVQVAFLEGMLGLMETTLEKREQLIVQLTRLFDPFAAPAEDSPHSWLDWLAGWLDLPLDETWSEAERREAIASAFSQYGRRGTAGSLRQVIAQGAGAAALIEEPATQLRLWSLGVDSRLSFDTQLAPAQAQGAVVGTSSILNQSNLTAEEEFGAPLFEDAAHRFQVSVYAADVPDRASQERLKEVIEAEKPAHTAYELCIIEARMRVGVQSRLGVDTIVAGDPTDLVLENEQRLGVDARLSRPDEPDGLLQSGRQVGRVKLS